MLGWAVWSEVHGAPKGREQMNSLNTDLAGVLAPLRAATECTSNYGSGKAMASCRYKATGDQASMERYYDGAFAARGWRRCGGESLSSARYSFAYCRGEDRASVERGYTATDEVDVNLTWGLP
jgi:hypothetical protein